MKYYLVPKEIAEKLDLVELRKSTPGGYFLLSEYDLMPYGSDKAVEEGAITLDGNTPQMPEPDAAQEETAEIPQDAVAEDDSEEASAAQDAGAGDTEGEETPAEGETTEESEDTEETSDNEKEEKI